MNMIVCAKPVSKKITTLSGTMTTGNDCLVSEQELKEYWQQEIQYEKERACCHDEKACCMIRVYQTFDGKKWNYTLTNNNDTLLLRAGDTVLEIEPQYRVYRIIVLARPVMIPKRNNDIPLTFLLVKPR